MAMPPARPRRPPDPRDNPAMVGQQGHLTDRCGDDLMTLAVASHPGPLGACPQAAPETGRTGGVGCSKSAARPAHHRCSTEQATRVQR